MTSQQIITDKISSEHDRIIVVMRKAIKRCQKELDFKAEISVFYVIDQIDTYSMDTHDPKRLVNLFKEACTGLVELKDISDEVLIQHFKKNVELETDKIDIDRIAMGISASQRSYILAVKDIIMELEPKFNKLIPIEEIVRVAREMGMDENSVDDAFEKLRRSGDIFEPKRGIISKI